MRKITLILSLLLLIIPLSNSQPLITEELLIPENVIGGDTFQINYSFTNPSGSNLEFFPILNITSSKPLGFNHFFITSSYLANQLNCSEIQPSVFICLLNQSSMAAPPGLSSLFFNITSAINIEPLEYFFTISLWGEEIPPPQEPQPSAQQSGGSSGGGGDGIYLDQYNNTLYLYLLNGHTYDIFFGNEHHTLSLIDINLSDNSSTLLFQSSRITAKILLGEVSYINYDSNEYNDISLKLLNIFNNNLIYLETSKVHLPVEIVLPIKEEPEPEPTAVPAEQPEVKAEEPPKPVQPPQEPEFKPYSKFIKYSVISLFLILLILFTYISAKKNQNI